MRKAKVYTEINDPVFEQQGVKIKLLGKSVEYGVLPENYEEADAWVINHADAWFVKRFLEKMINSDNKVIYLKPVFLLKKMEPSYSNKRLLVEHLSDGYLDNFDIIQHLPLVQRVKDYLENQLDHYDLGAFKTRNWLLNQKVFDYYYTRQKDIEPVLYSKSFSGYCYPRLEVFYENSREGFFNSRKQLSNGVNKGWLSRTYRDTCHLCKECYSGFLNYREICPRCKSHDLKIRPLVHHFRCAHIAIEDSFMSEGRMVCPKCSRELKELGVDYDRPGEIFLCQNKKCGHHFQDAPVGVHCIYCETEQAPEELLVKKAYNYKIIERGIEAGLKNSL